MAWYSMGRPGPRSGPREGVHASGREVSLPRPTPVRETADLDERNSAAARLVADGRAHLAVPELEALVEQCRWRLGAEDPETLVVEGNLAATLVMVGQDAAGTQLMAANLARRERVLGDEHPATLTARDALASTYRLSGHLPESLRLFSRVAPQRNRALGPSHPHTLVTRLGLGLAFAETGETGMARDVVSAAIEDAERAVADGRDVALLEACLDGLRRARDSLDAEADASVPAPEESPAEVTAFVPRQRTGPGDGASVTDLFAASDAATA